MAKKRRDQRGSQQKTLTKKQIARGRKVQRQQRTVWIAVAAVAALILIVIAVGVVQEFVLAPKRAVAVVDGEKITLEAYQKRVRYNRWYLQNLEQNLALQQASYDPNDTAQQVIYQYISSQLEQVQQQLYSVGIDSLEDLIDETLVRQEAERRGLTVTDEEVQLTIEQQLGYDRNPPEPTPTPITTTTSLTPTTTNAPMTEEEFQTAYSEFVDSLETDVKGFSEADMRDAIRQGLFFQKLSDALAAEVPTTDEQVHAYHILVEDSETAQEVLDKLNAGENFADLVTEYSQDQDTVDQGGELGWLARDQAGVTTTILDAAFALQPGEFSEPVESYLGFHVVTIDERDSDHPLDEETLSSRQSQALDDWLNEAKETADIERNWTLEDVPED